MTDDEIRYQIEQVMENTNKEIDRQAAQKLYDMYVNYKSVGFTASQSFSLVKGVLEATVTASMLRHRE
jgi:hypothetical protein